MDADVARGHVREAFASSPGLFELLSTVRSRRIGLGYRVDSGQDERHPVSGRWMRQETGPQEFVSSKEPVALTEVEEALLAWAACGPNGSITWEASMSGSFHQLVTTKGRTAPEANNTLATDLLVINDDGVQLYRPPDEVFAAVAEHGVDADTVLDAYRAGRTQVLAHRPDFDYGLRRPGAPDTPLVGTHQYNLNRPGSTWLLPLTDAGRLLSGIIDLFAGKRAYLVDDFAGNRPAGLSAHVDAGRLTTPVALSIYEQGVYRTSAYPAGCMVQNVRLAAEALGLGAWCLSGYDQDVLFGAHPDVTTGLGFVTEPLNTAIPWPAGRRKTYGLPGVKTATYVPSPDYPDADAIVRHWHDERYGPGAWGHPRESALYQPTSPWPADRATAITGHPLAAPPDWVWDAARDHIDYCVATYGQWPVTFDPMLAGFGVVVHHVDTDYYDRHLRPGSITERIREHQRNWHAER